MAKNSRKDDVEKVQIGKETEIKYGGNKIVDYDVPSAIQRMQRSRAYGNLPVTHKGVAFYDRERMRQPLPPIQIMHAGTCNVPVKYEAPPSWIKLPKSWGKWKPVPPNYFHNETVANNLLPIVHLPLEKVALKKLKESFVIAEGPDYSLRHCLRSFITSEGARFIHNHKKRKVTVTYLLTFTSEPRAVFGFINRQLAEEAVEALIKIRKAKHPAPKLGGRTTDNSLVFFTSAKRAKLPGPDIAVESITPN